MSGHADDCEVMVKLLTGENCTCGYDPEPPPAAEGCDDEASPGCPICTGENGSPCVWHFL